MPIKNRIFAGMRKWLLLFLYATATMAQSPITAVKTGTFYFKADDYAGFDAFGFQYFIKDNAFIKSNGKDKFEYKKIAFGKITRADIQNPLLMVLFYEDFNAAVLLDNQLNEVREIRFNDLSSPVVAHALGMAGQNRLWLFDTLTQQIMLFDYLKNTLTPLATPLKETVKTYQSDFNNFYWIDAKDDAYVIDVFGKVTAMGKVPPNDAMLFLSGQSILFTTDGKLLFRDGKSGTVQTVLGTENSPKKFYCEAQILAIFTNFGITNYKITLP
ncbi:hypothetical protein FLLO111716_05575 [Flavobacterium longum]